jgi:hypothetical protein
LISFDFCRIIQLDLNIIFEEETRIKEKNINYEDSFLTSEDLTIIFEEKPEIKRKKINYGESFFTSAGKLSERFMGIFHFVSPTTTDSV